MAMILGERYDEYFGFDWDNPDDVIYYGDDGDDHDDGVNDDYYYLRDLLDGGFKKKNLGILSGDEVKTIRETLHIGEKDIPELRDLRDFVVLYFTNFIQIDMESIDLLSAITGVIDDAIYELDGEV